jgi:hypothetical protein
MAASYFVQTVQLPNTTDTLHAPIIAAAGRGTPRTVLLL